MGIFTRFRDIVSSNINVMLDRAEDPEKLIKLMIREMEDTLVELKASCAGVMADSKRLARQLEDIESRIRYWEEKAGLAVRKARDDLAREALLEKRRFTAKKDIIEEEIAELDSLVGQYQDDIRQLEEKLKTARNKQRVLVQRHIHAKRKMRAQEDIRRLESSEVIVKFDELENRIERMEADAELVNFGKKPYLEEEFEKLGLDEDIEEELQSLKRSVGKTASGEPGTI
ncbi:MAG: phage shock protein PspA [Deltaproteobacteria bacterium]|nr:phage shock protein PspA [Deltaproteobacteria bacterium]MBW2152255.1 phage shock protein PspA [Deltaproteobacteria bacterium]